MEEQLELERRVWQRVRGQQRPEEDIRGKLAELIRLSRAQTRDLSRVDPTLYRQERQTLGLLTALYTLVFGGSVPEEGTEGRPGTAEACLRRCRKQLEGYLALERHPAWGQLFTALVRQKRAQCAQLEQRIRRPGGNP